MTPLQNVNGIEQKHNATAIRSICTVSGPVAESMIMVIKQSCTKYLWGRRSKYHKRIRGNFIPCNFCGRIESLYPARILISNSMNNTTCTPQVLNFTEREARPEPMQMLMQMQQVQSMFLPKVVTYTKQLEYWKHVEHFTNCWPGWCWLKQGESVEKGKHCLSVSLA